MDNIHVLQKAQLWRDQCQFGDPKGVVILRSGMVSGWMDCLRSPENWIPGCLAVDTDGKIWIAEGGNYRDGAERWEPAVDGLDKEDYEPYGPEWEKEMLKLDKKTLIGMIKAKGMEATHG